MVTKKERVLPVITHAIALRNHGTASEFGEMLWAVLGEVAAFYNLDKPRAQFQRRWIGDAVPPTAMTDADQVIIAKLDWNWWKGVRSEAGRLVDYKLLGSAVRELLPELERILIVTDEELNPPPDWRYVIWWDVSVKGDGAVSLAPLDPRYWGDTDPQRLETVKWRIRASLLCMTGLRLGFRRCQNTKCYLYENVDSVSVLDEMVTLGPEHSTEGLTDKVFAGEIDESLGLEAIIDQPAASSEF